MTGPKSTPNVTDLARKVRELHAVSCGDPLNGLLHVAFKELLEAAVALEAENARLRSVKTWLESRIEWLTKEARSGGNFQHLTTRRAEAACVLEKMRAALDTGSGPLDGPSAGDEGRVL